MLGFYVSRAGFAPIRFYGLRSMGIKITKSNMKYQGLRHFFLVAILETASCVQKCDFHYLLRSGWLGPVSGDMKLLKKKPRQTVTSLARAIVANIEFLGTRFFMFGPIPPREIHAMADLSPLPSPFRLQSY